MMHMAAHCAQSVHGAMAVHMHIPPIRGCAVCAAPMSWLKLGKGWCIALTARLRVGGCRD